MPSDLTGEAVVFLEASPARLLMKPQELTELETTPARVTPLEVLDMDRTVQSGSILENDEEADR